MVVKGLILPRIKSLVLIVTKLNQTHQIGVSGRQKQEKGRPPLFQNPKVTISCNWRLKS
ncbi:hypothetical protein Hanom_Chr07g00664321 [Helianthus anomalus]